MGRCGDSTAGGSAPPSRAASVGAGRIVPQFRGPEDRLPKGGTIGSILAGFYWEGPILERFKVPVEDQVRVSVGSLRETVTAVFGKMGVPPEDAAEGANTLVMTDVRGVETHGVSNMLRSYVEGYRTGELNPKREWRIVKETQGSAVIDAERTLAIVYGPSYMRIAIEKAKQVGTGLVTLYNSGHTGAIGHHAMLAADEGMIGICTTATGVMTPPTFGAEPKMGTNPFAFAAPAGQEAPLLFDAATTVIAGNKMGLASRVGANLLPGWISRDRRVTNHGGDAGQGAWDLLYAPVRNVQGAGLPQGVCLQPHDRGVRNALGIAPLDAGLRRRGWRHLRRHRYLGVHRRGRVQREYGQDAAVATGDQAGPGPRPRALSGALRARGGAGQTRQWYPPAQRGNRVVQPDHR